MSIRVCIEGDSIEEIYEELKKTLNVSFIEEKPFKKKTKKKATKKKVAKTSDVLVAIENPKSPAEKQAKQKDVHAALQFVNSERGFQTAKAILDRFDCTKLSELKPQDYENFIIACEDECRG